MNSFAFLIVAIQACLIQNVYGQCLRGAIAPAAPCWDSLAPAIATPYAGSIASPLGYGGLYGAEYGYKGACGSYGGAGIGNVAVAGELPVAGTTVVAGQVPILGAVEFGGPACAAGAVSIAGSCGCGCGSPYVY
ncbi:hypothetical protein K1T71_014170 [Dendrolimus kikuchii]|uniref:Uncharacterized protein n=1 Tax=Dendrolimus kikuchii TaxID=765133 RepID=A0ACC1CFL8_9NEOP|nr:hypothetical protein K1T71_014170 [Dendrolimus kikuchii]